MASEMRAADWVDEVNQADSLDELDDILNRYADSGADYKSVEDAVEKKRATLSGEIPEEEPDEDAADEEDDGRAKLQLGDPSAGQTPDPEAVEAAEAEAAEQAAEAPEQLPTGEEYEEKTLLLPGTWVVLADTPRVPIEVVGHEACVTFAPVKTSDGDEQIPFRHQYQDEDITFTVQTRDAYNATVTGLTREDFAEISYNGRAGLGSSG